VSRHDSRAMSSHNSIDSDHPPEGSRDHPHIGRVNDHGRSYVHAPGTDRSLRTSAYPVPRQRQP
jgi:hypothetical protein